MSMRADEERTPWEAVKELIACLATALEADDYPKVRSSLRDILSGYNPEGDIVDWIYQQRRCAGCNSMQALLSAGKG